MYRLTREMYKLLREVLRHPLSRGYRFSTARRILTWQFASRMIPGECVFPFTSKTQLFMNRGMHGATGNFYFGLDEFDDMAFVLNVLREQDLFVDIGANIGSYSILASGHAGARTVSVEPVPATFARLRKNVRYNNIDHLVALHNCGISDRSESLQFTTDLDSTNHIATDDDVDAETIEVTVVQLDKMLDGLQPLCIKIDVEGFEEKVVNGGKSVLQSESLRAVLMELNGSGNRYGFDEDEIHNSMERFGFRPFVYEAFKRKLTPLPGRNLKSGNTLYLRNLEFIRDRLSSASEIELPWRRVQYQK